MNTLLKQPLHQQFPATKALERKRRYDRISRPLLVDDSPHDVKCLIGLDDGTNHILASNLSLGIDCAELNFPSFELDMSSSSSSSSLNDECYTSCPPHQELPRHNMVRSSWTNNLVSLGESSSSSSSLSSLFSSTKDFPFPELDETTIATSTAASINGEDDEVVVDDDNVGAMEETRSASSIRRNAEALRKLSLKMIGEDEPFVKAVSCLPLDQPTALRRRLSSKSSSISSASSGSSPFKRTRFNVSTNVNRV